MKTVEKCRAQFEDEYCVECGFPFDQDNWLLDAHDGQVFCSKACVKKRYREDHIHIVVGDCAGCVDY